VDRRAPRTKPPVITDEQSIIDSVAKGDACAFETLYRSHVGRVYATCLRLSGDQDKAEEITQDVFLKLWQRIGSFKGQSAFSSWLYRLTVNLVIDRMRSQARRAARETISDEIDSYPDRDTPQSVDTKLSLETAIRSLPFGARLAFVLHDIEGYKHVEIAEMSGIAAGTSKAQLHRARKLLRKMLR